MDRPRTDGCRGQRVQRRSGLDDPAVSSFGGQVLRPGARAVRGALQEVEHHHVGFVEQPALPPADIVVGEAVQADAVPEPVVVGVVRFTGSQRVDRRSCYRPGGSATTAIASTSTSWSGQPRTLTPRRVLGASW